MNKKIVSGFAFAVLAASGIAHAGFTVEGELPSSVVAGQSKAVGSAPGLVQIGMASAGQPVVKGAAREISMLTALKQIVPPGWKAKRGGEVDMAKLVSWRGGNRVWVDILEDLAVSAGVSITIDWGKQELTVAPSSYQPTGDGVRPVTTTKAASGPVNKVWVLEKGLSLRENVEKWAKSAGWTVSWASVDYPVSSAVTLSGVFDDEASGPFNQLAKAYESALQPLTFTFYTNKVLRVENATFRPSGVHDQLPNRRAMQ